MQSLLCLTLCNLMDCSPPVSSVHGISQARILEWIAFLSAGIFLTQGSNPSFLHQQADSLPLSYLGSPHIQNKNPKLILSSLWLLYYCFHAFCCYIHYKPHTPMLLFLFTQSTTFKNIFDAFTFTYVFTIWGVLYFFV